MSRNTNVRKNGENSRITKRNMRVRTRFPPWRRSGSRTCLYRNSLLTGNFTGNLAGLVLRRPFLQLESAALQPFVGQFPNTINRESSSKSRERTGWISEFLKFCLPLKGPRINAYGYSNNGGSSGSGNGPTGTAILEALRDCIGGVGEAGSGLRGPTAATS
jgi:hypothetical protein